MDYLNSSSRPRILKLWLISTPEAIKSAQITEWITVLLATCVRPKFFVDDDTDESSPSHHTREQIEAAVNKNAKLPTIDVQFFGEPIDGSPVDRAIYWGCGPSGLGNGSFHLICAEEDFDFADTLQRIAALPKNAIYFAAIEDYFYSSKLNDAIKRAQPSKQVEVAANEFIVRLSAWSRKTRAGYIPLLAAHYWFGDLLFSDIFRPRILSFPHAERIEELPNGIIHLHLYEGIFDGDKPENQRRQYLLREHLGIG